MPKNKTRRLFTPLLLFFAENPLKRRVEHNRGEIPSTECQCSPQAILAKLRGQPVPLCTELPWHCPLIPKPPKN